MNKLIRIAIITARNLRASPESNNTVLNILNSLDKKKYKIDIVLIDNLIPSSLKIPIRDLRKLDMYDPFSKIKNNKKVNDCINLSELKLSELKHKYDIAIVPIYCTYGEDGKVLGLLDIVGIPYISPGAQTSIICLDKTLTKAVFRQNDILTPKGIHFHKYYYKYNKIKNLVHKSFDYPIMVKAASSGASYGVSMISDDSQLEKAITEAYKFSDEFIIEEYIKGDEYTVGVVGKHSKPQALPVVLIKTKNDFFDYEAKYSPGCTEEICPAPISKKLKSQLQKTAIEAYQAVRADSHSRIDMIVSNKNIYVLEINTFPGLTSGSIFPKELEASGSSLSEFFDQTIEEKLKEYKKN